MVIPGVGRYGGNSSDGVALTHGVLPPISKLSTLLVVPLGGGTLSTDPLGHLQYVGETDFDLLLVNVTSTTTPVTLGGIQGGAARVRTV